MVNISSAYNSKGARLLAKYTNQVISKEKGSCLEKIENISSQAKTYDIAAIDQNFGENLVEIFSFRDAAGKLIQRIQKTSGGKNSLKVSNYNYTGKPGNETRKIERKTYENGKVVNECLENIFAFARGFFKNKYFVSKTSFNRDLVNDASLKAEEKSLYGIFQSKLPSKKIIAKAERYKDNSVKAKGFQFSGITKDEAKELAKDPYITMRLLPYQDFVSTVKHKVYADHDLLRAQIKTYKAPLGTERLSPLAQARYQNGSISILLNKQKPELESKPKLVESFNHEGRHCRQYIYVEQLEHMNNLPYYSSIPDIRYRQGIYGIPKDEESVKFAQKMNSGFENYVPAEKNEQSYFNNDTEIDARAAGSKAKEEYTSFADTMQSILPLTNEQLGL